MKRAGVGNIIVFALFTAGAIAAAIAAFVLSVTVGRILMGRISPPILMLVWDGVIAGFLFFWMIGLIAELQRSELLSFDKFLHLPIPLTGVFLMNYLGSFISLSLIVFVPGMVGLSIALVFAKGRAMYVLFPMLAGLILVVTALTYQFQGWLAAMMVNKRRRRTIIAFVTLIFVLIVQIPNFLNATGYWGGRGNTDSSRQMRDEIREIDRSLAAGQIDKDEYQRQYTGITSKYRAERRERNRRELETAERAASVANLVIPLGWPAFGARRAAEGAVLPALLVSAGLFLIAAASLWRSYRTTMRLYTGHFNSGTTAAAAIAVNVDTAPAQPQAVQSSLTLLEKRLPWISEHASAVALTCFRSLTRAPEAKMLLLSPIIMVVVFGGMIMRRNSAPPEFVRPLLAAGAISMVLLSVSQIAANQFGFDRSGFRVFVLASAARKDILLGKNLSLVPLVFALCGVVLVLIEVIYPMRADHFVATLLQIVPMYLVYCIVANTLSTYAPMPMASGSLKPVQPKGMMILLHFAFIFVLPVAMAFTMLPLGIELLLEWLGWSRPFPIYLVFALMEGVGVVFLYDLALRWQGDILQKREQRILEIVTSKIE